MTDNNQTIVNPPVIDKATKSQKIEYVIYFFFGLVETLLAFRLVFKLMGASLASAFVRLIYVVTGIFVLPFNGIFQKGYTQGLETTSVLEPATVVAIIVYIIIAWGIVKLVRISSGEQQES
jgi:uncharacterized membrane protein YuzA (DUF378 family)